MILRLSGITKNFHSNGSESCILDNLFFEINKGEFISIIGPSGSGKSTFLQIAGLLDSFEQGNIFFDNKDITNISEKEKTKIRRQDIGFIYQFHHLLPEFTALENLIIPQLINNANYEEAENSALEVLKSFNIEYKANSYPSEMSGGEQQRIAIGRSLVNQPKIILADEPTGNLDHNNAQRTVNLLRQIVDQSDISVIMVTHNVELATQADRVVTIVDGKICDYEGVNSNGRCK